MKVYIVIAQDDWDDKYWALGAYLDIKNADERMHFEQKRFDMVEILEAELGGELPKQLKWVRDKI